MLNKIAIGVLVFCGLIIGGGLVVHNKVENIEQERSIKVEQLKVSGLGETYPPGEIIALKIEDFTKADKVNYSWTILDAHANIKLNTIIFPAGDVVFFGGGINSPNKFTIILVASYIVNGELVTKTCHGHVYVGSKPDPTPTPIPIPVPTPVDPTFPDGKYKLAGFTYKLVKESVTSPNRILVAKALSDSYNSVASAISAGAYTDVKTILEKTRESNLQALNKSGANLKDWEPMQLKMTDYIYEYYKNGTLRTAGDFAVAWREIAEGLNGVK